MATKKSSGTKSASSRPRASKKSASTPAVDSVVTVHATTNFHGGDVQERIRQRAFTLFQERGGQHGFDIEDWLRAESEVLKPE